MRLYIELEKATPSTVSGGAMNIFGVSCNDPEALAKKRKKELMKAFGLDEKNLTFSVDCAMSFAEVLAAAKPEAGKK